ncbi:sensor histidine kinase [Halapricum hydrolyticum]|uniref:histidine kinase n=1 Tax=Halapricum hydrolyticum TaxID=2979991 RepID=A0AAE3LGI2_9EURY|nr:PAS domain-containing sensor histidine kinase [Halapricum hydrolyticum]MCU4716756.1 PAS domain-containing sensor histidine kinase [Halapricum hydrolyticum]MCU4725639.1 PAS domain-containing sensor histidine kinase [Halapricum hydrolyticum]
MARNGAIPEYVAVALKRANAVVWAVDTDTKDVVAKVGNIPPLESVIREIDDISSFFERGVHPDDLPEVEPLYRQIFDRERTQFGVDFRTHPDHCGAKWVHIDAYLMETDGDPLLVGVAWDITDRKRREQDLRDQKDRLEEFSGVLSHDLRNPIEVAAGHLELAKTKREDEHLEAVEKSLREMEALIDDLQAALSEGGPVVRGGAVSGVTTEQLDLKAVARGAWEAVETADATLSVEKATIRADRSSLRQLFENLFRNAVEHAGPDVTVTVGALDEQDGFYVADDGPGIPDGARDAVFERGYSTDDDGLGLGLYIVSQIADSAGWTITVTDNDAGGTRFEIADVRVS